MWLHLVLLALSYLFYKYAIKPLTYWKDRNVPHKRPWPIIGNMWNLIIRKVSFIDNVILIYNQFPGKRYSGIFQFHLPVFVIRDLNLLKKITIKDFDYFTDHRSVVPDDVDPVFAKNLVALKGQRWKEMRANLSPAFTSSKMRGMFYLMSECSKEFTNYFLKKDEQITEVEMKDVFSRFTNDVIASTAFGIKIDSLTDQNNEFFAMGRDVTSISGLRAIKFFILNFFPIVMKVFRIKLFPKASTFFENLVSQTIKIRERDNIIRPDMIHLLMEAKKGNLKYEEDTATTTDAGFATVTESQIGQVAKPQKQQLTDMDIAAQALLFFFAGFDTSSTVMSFMAHELAVNVEIQEKLQQEIDDVLEECNGEITYDAISKMKYLDMVVSEVLRKWTPGVATDRVCVKDYAIEPENEDEKPLIIEKGTSIFIPIRAFHYDPQYFPDPEKFDPDRFSDENKHKILPYSYIPFGIGPRNCIASRFGLLEVKTIYFHLLSKFNLTVVSKTCVPMVLTKKKLRMEPDNGFWLGLERRENVHKA